MKGPLNSFIAVLFIPDYFGDGAGIISFTYLWLALESIWNWQTSVLSLLPTNLGHSLKSALVGILQRVDFDYSVIHDTLIAVNQYLGHFTLYIPTRGLGSREKCLLGRYRVAAHFVVLVLTSTNRLYRRCVREALKQLIDLHCNYTDSKTKKQSIW